LGVVIAITEFQNRNYLCNLYCSHFILRSFCFGKEGA
jgi:hypothetical protein